MSDKPARPWPPLFAVLWPRLQERARELGYALALHGSLGRDLDLVAVPWVESAVPAEELLRALVLEVGWANDGVAHGPEVRPHGRLAWCFPVGAGAYVDLSVLPLRPA